MISPGEQLTMELFVKLKREIERRGRIWSAPPIESSNITSGVMLRSIAGPGAAASLPAVITARLQAANFLTTPISYDWVEVVRDPGRADFVPKPGGRRSIIINNEVSPPNNDHAAFELNNTPLIGPTGIAPYYPVNQVVILNPLVDGMGNPTGYWWFDYAQPRDRSLLALDRGQAGDCAWVGAESTSVANSACSPVGYRYGSPYGQPIGLYVLPDGSSTFPPNPCDVLGALLGGCTTPNDGSHGDAVVYHTCCASPLSETLFMTVPSGEISGSFNDTIPPGTYQFNFVLADGYWESASPITNAIQPPNDATKLFFAGSVYGCGIGPNPTLGALLTAPAQTIFISCDPFLAVIEWSGQAGRQTLSFSL